MIKVQLIIFLGAAIFGVFSNQCDQYTSPLNGCICQPSLDGYDELHCSSSEISEFVVKIRKEYVEIQCNNAPDWSDFPLNGTFAENDQRRIYFTMCPLPKDLSLVEICERLGINGLEELSFQSYGNLSNTLTYQHLQNLPDLVKLTLSSNGLMNFTKELLQDVPKLMWLDLRDNNLELTTHDMFEYTRNISMLELGRNKISYIDPATFTGLSELSFLNLWRNRITKLEPGTFDGLTSLNSLDLNTNGLIELPPNIFRDLTNLEVLNMFGNNFTTLPKDLLRGLNNLKIINLHDNKRNLTLPDEFFGNLTSLKSVKLRRNKLYSVPENLFWGTTSLEHLYLERNYLVTIPPGFFRDTVNLISLDLSINFLETLPDYVFSKLNNLKVLDLTDNQLTVISRYLFHGLTSLTDLNMSQNKLTVIHDLGLTYLGKLKTARFSENNLTLKPTMFSYQDEYGTLSPFYQCKELENLYLAYNNISEMFSDWIVSSPTLRLLDLRYNNFSYISIEDLQFISNDNIQVKLNHNNISRVILTGAEDIASSQEKPRNAIITIEDNPIICDCSLYDFLRYLEGRMHPYVQNYVHIIPGDLRCGSPEWLKNVSVTSLKSTNLKCMLDGSLRDIACLEECECWLRPEDKAFLVNCSNKNLTAINQSRLMSNIQIPKRYRIELDFRGNSLTQIPHMYPKNVVSLLLSHNNISEVSMDMLPTTLEVLELDHNNISSLDSNVLEFLKNSTSLSKLTLHENPWKCDCDTRDFLNFVQAEITRIPELLEVKCSGMNVSLSKLTTNQLCFEETTTIIGISIAIAITGLIIGVIAALYYRHQREIKIWLYARQWCLWFVTEDELDKDKPYDAFISYSHKDEEFVLNELVSKLESGPTPYKLCIHIRNWQAGEWIPTQIVRSVEDSKRTIVVLSPSFLKSVWGRMEFRAAHSQALSEGRARVILIIYGDIGSIENLDPELKAYVSMNTYVKWGDPWFWDKLRYAMPHPPQLTKSSRFGQKIFEKHRPCIEINNEKKELVCPVTVAEPSVSLKATIV